MPWIYSQSAGTLTRDGELIATGYSGAGAGRNNPADQAIPDIGPIPQGLYTIGPEFTAQVQGPLSMCLTPDGHDAMGRNGFMIHGDNATHTASRGCIILPRECRETIAASEDRQLQVVA